MDSFAHQPRLKERGRRRHGHRPRSARMRAGSQRSAAQLRALDAPGRNRVRAELRAVRLMRAVG